MAIAKRCLQILVLGLAGSIHAAALAAGSKPLKIDGYKGAKWGMTQEEVRSILKLRVKEQTGHAGSYKHADYVRFILEGPLLVECWFHHGKLYRVQYPFHYADQKMADVRQVLEQKYGRPTIVGFLNEGGCAARGKGDGENGFTECASWHAGNPRSRMTLWGSTTGVNKGYSKSVEYENLEMRQRAETEATLNDQKDIKIEHQKKIKQLNERL